MPVETYGRFYIHTAIDGQVLFDSGNKKKEYNDVVMVHISVLGTDKISRSKKVFEADGETPVINENGQTYIDMYPRAWAVFNRDEGYQIDGTPITDLHGIGPSQALNLQTKGIESVEQLASLSDSFVIGESGMLDLRKKAQAYIAAMNPEQALAEKKAQQDEMADLRRQVEQLQEAAQNQSKPRGRPKKAETA